MRFYLADRQSGGVLAATLGFVLLFQAFVAGIAGGWATAERGGPGAFLCTMLGPAAAPADPAAPHPGDPDHPCCTVYCQIACGQALAVPVMESGPFAAAPATTARPPAIGDVAIHRYAETGPRAARAPPLTA